jgi:hypothetical protein
MFACAVEWPGWCRAGKTETDALDALAASLPRYAAVAEDAGVRFPPRPDVAFEVVERVNGSAATDFGVPGSTPACDREPLTSREAARLVAFIEASWRALERSAAVAPAELRKGPRGGGRDRDAIVEHVVSAEDAYTRKVGIRVSRDEPDLVAARRAEIVRIISGARRGDPIVAKGWTPRYAARRISWHALDHAWEIEDRSEPE